VSAETEPLDEVTDALGLTIEVVEDLIGDIKAATAMALADDDYDAVETATARLRELQGFAGAVEELLARWQGSSARPAPAEGAPDVEATAAEHEPRRFLGRIPRGLRTPEPAFRVPVLTVLAEAGGALAAADALDRVGEAMESVLNDVDRQPLASTGSPRWRNTAQWARNELADRGYIDRSVRGRWSITPAGRAWLESRR